MTKQSTRRPARGAADELPRLNARQWRALRWVVYREVPQADWILLSGRGQKILADQQARYGIPVGRGPIDLAAVARWIHDTIAEHGDAIRTDTAGSKSLARRYREAQTARAEAEARRALLLAEAAAGRSVSIDDHAAGLMRLARILVGGVSRLAAELGALVPDLADAISERTDAIRADLARQVEATTGPAGIGGNGNTETGGDAPRIRPAGRRRRRPVKPDPKQRDGES